MPRRHCTSWKTSCRWFSCVYICAPGFYRDTRVSRQTICTNSDFRKTAEKEQEVSMKSGGLCPESYILLVRLEAGKRNGSEHDGVQLALHLLFGRRRRLRSHLSSWWALVALVGFTLGSRFFNVEIVKKNVGSFCVVFDFCWWCSLCNSS